MDDKNFENDMSAELDQDFDYELYALKYGIDLRPEPAEDKAPVRTRSAKASGKSCDAKMELYDWLQCIVSAILCGILVFVFVGRVIGVEGSSMLHTLVDQDKVGDIGALLHPKIRRCCRHQNGNIRRHAYRQAHYCHGGSDFGLRFFDGRRDNGR